MEDFEKRMIDEYQELSDRVNKLETFLNTSEPELLHKLDEEGELWLLHNQVNAMCIYQNMLLARLSKHGLVTPITPEEAEAMKETIKTETPPENKE